MRVGEFSLCPLDSPTQDPAPVVSRPNIAQTLHPATPPWACGLVLLVLVVLVLLVLLVLVAEVD